MIFSLEAGYMNSLLSVVCTIQKRNDVKSEILIEHSPTEPGKETSRIMPDKYNWKTMAVLENMQARRKGNQRQYRNCTKEIEIGCYKFQCWLTLKKSNSLHY